MSLMAAHLMAQCDAGTRLVDAAAEQAEAAHCGMLTWWQGGRLRARADIRIPYREHRAYPGNLPKEYRR